MPPSTLLLMIEICRFNSNNSTMALCKSLNQEKYGQTFIQQKYNKLVGQINFYYATRAILCSKFNPQMDHVIYCRNTDGPAYII